MNPQRPERTIHGARITVTYEDLGDGRVRILTYQRHQPGHQPQTVERMTGHEYPITQLLGGGR